MAATAADAHEANVANVADEATVGDFNALTVMIAPTTLALGMCFTVLFLS